MSVTHASYTDSYTSGSRLVLPEQRRSKTTASCPEVLAVELLDKELHKRQLLNPEFNPEEIWAAITYDGRVRIGTPMLHCGQGYYLDYQGRRLDA